jgi:hypothetical protein
MLAVHFENLLFLLLIAMAALLRLLASKTGQPKKKAQNPDPRSLPAPRASEPIRRVPKETDAERIRRFLEALGQPATSPPPTPVVPRTDIPPRPLAPIQPPPGTFSMPRGRFTPDERRKRGVILPETSLVTSPVFEVQEQPVQIEPPSDIKSPAKTYPSDSRQKTELAPTATSMAALLRSSPGLRNAIILREIFGPPRSLQSLDLVGSA